MDCLIKCYLDRFATVPRNTLHDRRKRRTVLEYVNTLVQGRIQGREDPEAAVREAVLAMMRYHEENRTGSGSACTMGRHHNVLHVAAKLCYDWRLRDTGTVVALLERIYSCEGSFERLLIGAIFGTVAPHYLVGWKSDFDGQENLGALVYFMDHAADGGLEMEGKLRFVDAPIEACGSASPVKVVLQLGLPDRLHILLRYGALVSRGNIEHLLRRLMDFCHVYPYNMVACLQLILRVVPRIECSKEEILDNYEDLIKDEVVPLARVEVPELKHLARCSIRKRLWENYRLPGGIKYLSLPDSLRRYVDIMED